MAELRKDVQQVFDAIGSLLEQARDPIRRPDLVLRDLVEAINLLGALVLQMARIVHAPSPVFTRGNDRFVAWVAVGLVVSVGSILIWKLFFS